MKLNKLLIISIVLLLMLNLSFQWLAQQQKDSASEERETAWKFFQEADVRMIGFYLEPTQQSMDELAKLFNENRKHAAPRSTVGLFGSVVMGLASKKFELKINQEGPLFDVARAVANDDENHPLVKLLNDDSEVGEMRLKVWCTHVLRRVTQSTWHACRS